MYKKELDHNGLTLFYWMTIYFLSAAILLEKIFTAIANKITPKNLRTAKRPPGPSIRSMKFNDFNTT